jgi:TfoX/Sxy family transcriptional regulator of competence genes
MPYNQFLIDKIRQALAVEERKMFRGICFMVNDKMCVCVSGDDIMCRVDPEIYEEAIERIGTRPMMMRGRTVIGFIYVEPEGYRSKKEFDHWIALCLSFNRKARSSKEKKKKSFDR